MRESRVAPIEPIARPAQARPLKPRGRRRAAAMLVELALVGAAAVAFYFFALVPSGREAPALARAQVLSHDGAFPAAAPPARFVTALVATEDHRFYSPFDPGVDPIAATRALIGWALGRRGDLGGSTLEQQLAKMLYTPGRKSLRAKLEQVAIGVKLRFLYSKAQILSMYAEIVYFGDGYYGLEQASCGYFSKRPEAMDWGQAAMLAGVVNGPSIFDPRHHPQNARRRQRHVFDRLVAVGALTREQADQARAAPLGLKPGHCGRPGAAECCSVSSR